jgi:hypothetical protein
MTKRILALGVALLLCAVCSWAQKTPQQPNVNKSPASTPGYEVIEGCLQKFGVEYILTDKNGLLHHLSGGKLKQYVGHEVQLSGKPSVKTVDTTPPGAASSALEVPIFVVKSVKDVGATCQAAH